MLFSLYIYEITFKGKTFYYYGRQLSELDNLVTRFRGATYNLFLQHDLSYGEKVTATQNNLLSQIPGPVVCNKQGIIQGLQAIEHNTYERYFAC